MTSLRRYAPFALLVATQMVLVLVAPSHGSSGGTQLGGQFQGGPAAQSGVPGSSVNGAVGTGAPGTTGVPGATGTTTGATGVPGATGSTGGGGGTGTLASGSTTGGKFCITGLTEHFPCAPKWAGGDNGGATWSGVTANQVTVVMYRAKDNPAVDAILQETGTYTPPSAEQQMVGVVQNWINKHFQLYNRKIKLIWTQGSCDIAPPSDSCFRTDADNLVTTYHPFAVFWTSDTNEPAFFDELSRKGVVNWGGWAFTDNFNQSLRPYHYDVFMGGDTQAEISGRWICQRLANQKAKYAGDAALKTQTRKFAVTYPDTATTTPAAKHLESIIKSCAGSVYDSPYSSNTSTAAQQATTNTAQTRQAGVTTIVWFSDVIAPAYGTKAQASQNWHPEEVIAGEGLLDYDALAQTYDQTEWAHAFGPSDIAEQAPINNSDAGLIWKQEGNSGSPNQNSNLLTSYALSVAGGIMAAGPKLTPLTYEYGMLTQPGYDSWEQWHNPHYEYIKYGKGDYTGISDIREVYYDPNKTSPTNNRAGAYVALHGGQRYQLNNIPSGDPGLPASV